MAKKDYSNFDKKELIEEIKKLEKRKKYGLVWEDKPEKVAEMCKEKLPVLEEDKEREIVTDKEKDYNILIEGDNYHALSVLNYTHKGKIDLIYIDPPYNTGNKEFAYNDRIVDLEDPYRHSKWLSFMEKRLRLAKELLKNEGVIFISIDDNENAQLKLLCDEVFNEENFIAQIIWRRKRGKDNSARYFSRVHEYILVYSKNNELVNIKKIDLEESTKRAYTNKDKDKRGPYRLLGAWARGTQGGSKYSFTSLSGLKFNERLWLVNKETMERYDKERRLVFIGDKVYRKLFLSESSGSIPETIWSDTSNTANASDEIKALFGSQVFETPKPTPLIKRIVQIAAGKNSNILDFFAGSGTTAQAVLELNKQDGGARNFILCTNNENNICVDVCYPRIKKVIKKLASEENEKLVKFMPGNLKYFKTDFVDAELTDSNKEKMVKKSTDMLCLKEDCFEEITHGNNFKVFTDNKEKWLGIVYGDDGINSIKKIIAKLNKKLIVYVFSLDDSAREDQFEDVKNLVELRPIPAVILNVYKRIFK